MDLDVTTLLAIAAGLIGALGCFWWLGAGRPDKTQPHTDAPQDTLSVVFEAGQVVDASDRVSTLLGLHTLDAVTWPDLARALALYFDDVPTDLPDTPFVRRDANGLALHITPHGNRVRVDLSIDPDAPQNAVDVKLTAINLTSQRDAVSAAPFPIWWSTHDKTLLWYNDAFAQMAAPAGSPEDLAREIATAFEGETHDADAPPKRISVPQKGTQKDRWFEVIQKPEDQGVLTYANSIDPVIQAEEAQRKFVQTLSKTFAHLTTGLAVFDRDRRLALFNPALIDLSGLSAEFLSSRPNLFLFFDKMREQQIMPEPKNYGSWREGMAKLAAAASDDRFNETWNLPNGLTYQVSGRPHPDGAVAFLFEDISAEISLTRRFRTEIELSQSALDALDDAIALFNPLGVLTLCNEAYKSMWSVDPDTQVQDYSIFDATQQWTAAFQPTPIWPELRDFVTTQRDRAPWEQDVRRKDGAWVSCRIDPVANGSTMVRFVQAKSGDVTVLPQQNRSAAAG